MNPTVILAAAGAFIENALVKKVLINLAESISTPTVMGTEIDNWVIKILYGADAIDSGKRKEVVEEALSKVQATYDEAKSAAEAGDSTKLDALKKVRELTFQMGDTVWPPTAAEAPEA